MGAICVEAARFLLRPNEKGRSLTPERPFEDLNSP
jgi:hypothetical protein